MTPVEFVRDSSRVNVADFDSVFLTGMIKTNPLRSCSLLNLTSPLSEDNRKQPTITKHQNTVVATNVTMIILSFVFTMHIRFQLTLSLAALEFHCRQPPMPACQN